MRESVQPLSGVKPFRVHRERVALASVLLPNDCERINHCDLRPPAFMLHNHPFMIIHADVKLVGRIETCV